MKILHTSDLHGDVRKLRRILAQNTRWDVWVDTGDLCPNYYVPLSPADVSHMSTHGVSFHRQSWFDQLCEDLCWDQVQSGKLSFRDALVAAEQKAQTSWAQTILADLIPQGREVLFLSGNHDFIRVGDILGKKQIWPDFVEIGNHRFAGFPHVTYANGDYNHETQDRRSPVSQAFYAEPTILVTHIPPQGILSDEFGCSSLSSALAYSSHKIQAHLFGHCHRTCGVTTEDGILFSNAATMGRILEI